MCVCVTFGWLIGRYQWNVTIICFYLFFGLSHSLTNDIFFLLSQSRTMFFIPTNSKQNIMIFFLFAIKENVATQTFSSTHEYIYCGVPMTYMCSGCWRIQSISWFGFNWSVQILWIAVNNGNLWVVRTESYISEGIHMNDFIQYWSRPSTTHLASIPLFFNMKLTSSAVIGPCSFCPLSISVSSSLIDLPVLT